MTGRMAYTIRRAEAGDAAAMRRVMLAAYAPHSGLDGLPDMGADCAAEIAAKDVRLAIETGRDAAGVGERVVGVLVLAAAPEVDDGGGGGGRFLRLANLAVDPAAQGGGLGRRLLALAETVARARGCAGLCLTSHGGMTRTLAFYRRQGWRETGRFGVAVAMEKRLCAG